MNFLKKHKGKFIFGFVAIIILTVAFMMGDEPVVPETTAVPASVTDVSKEKPTPDVAKNSQEPVATAEAEEKTATQEATAEPTIAPEQTIEPQPTEVVIEVVATPQPAKTTATPTEKPKAEDKNICTLSVRCDTILSNMPKLKPEKEGLIPSDGVILPKIKVEFNKGESVYNILVREMKKNKIHLEFVNVPVYNSAYIEGIANLYENDCGDLSGWMYKVNGIFPNYGSSKYTVKDGDVIEWVYTCDRGNDVGGGYAPKNGKKDD